MDYNLNLHEIPAGVGVRWFREASSRYRLDSIAARLSRGSFRRFETCLKDLPMGIAPFA
jgi:hypothetical protein